MVQQFQNNFLNVNYWIKISTKKINMRLHLEEGYSKENTEKMESLEHIQPSNIFQGEF